MSVTAFVDRLIDPCYPLRSKLTRDSERTSTRITEAHPFSRFVTSESVHIKRQRTPLSRQLDPASRTIILDFFSRLQGRQFITCKFAFLRSEKSRNEGEEVGDNLGPLKPS